MNINSLDINDYYKNLRKFKFLYLILNCIFKWYIKILDLELKNYNYSIYEVVYYLICRKIIIEFNL